MMYVLDGIDVQICNAKEMSVEAIKVWILFFELAMIYLIRSDKKVFINYKFFLKKQCGIPFRRAFDEKQNILKLSYPSADRSYL